MINEKEEQYCSDGECIFAGNVVLLAHGELGFWQCIRTRMHLITCGSCKQRKVETLAVRGHFLSLNGMPGSALPIRISPRFIRMQVAIASVVAVASVILAYSSINAYFPDSSRDAAPSSTVPATNFSPKSYGERGASKKPRPRGLKPRKQSTTVTPKSPDSIE